MHPLLKPEFGLLIWTLIAFLIVFFILRKFAWPAIIKGLKDRHNSIAESLATAEKINAWMSGSLEDWFYDSHVISDLIYDASPAESKLGYKYNFQFQKILDEQLLKGGVRLAALLNRAFDRSMRPGQ